MVISTLFHKEAIAQPNWSAIKINATFNIQDTSFGKPYIQPLNVEGWEDGVFITRDGLNLYCFYVPIDLFSWTFLGNGTPDHFSSYLRGPTFGMDLATNPIGASEWLQSDILYSHRNSDADSFVKWQLSNMALPVFSEGAPQINRNTDSSVDLFVYTSNNVQPAYKTNIVLLRNSGLNPSTQGSFLPYPVNTDSTEDNPHIERIDSLNLVIFFDSDNRPGGIGQLDIWYSTSADNGITWNIPIQVSTLNTKENEQQPHLYKDINSNWYIYFTATNTVTQKPEIYRAIQKTIGDWDSWTNRELVIGAGNTAGVGEPTLTQNGDIAFIAIYKDSINGTPTDKYDADPWFLPKLSKPQPRVQTTANINKNYYLMPNFPNPFNTTTSISYNLGNLQKGLFTVYSLSGRILFSKEIMGKGDLNWNAGNQPNGIYICKMNISGYCLSQKMLLTR